MPAERIAAGLQREEALRIYQSSVRDPVIVFYPDELPKRLAHMREYLHDPVTEDEAVALNDVIRRRRTWSVLMPWLKEQAVSWKDHCESDAFRTDEADRLLAEYLHDEDEKWAKGLPSATPFRWVDSEFTQEELAERNVEHEWLKAFHLKKAKPCPRCGTPPEQLEWFYYCDPPSSWRDYSTGWKTRCGICLQEVQFFWGMTVHGARPEVPKDFRPS
jgi:hypothetical protein